LTVGRFVIAAATRSRRRLLGVPLSFEPLYAQAEQARAVVGSPIAIPGALDWFSGRWWGFPIGRCRATARTRVALAVQGANAIVPG